MAAPLRRILSLERICDRSDSAATRNGTCPISAERRGALENGYWLGRARVRLQNRRLNPALRSGGAGKLRSGNQPSASSGCLVAWARRSSHGAEVPVGPAEVRWRICAAGCVCPSSLWAILQRLQICGRSRSLRSDGARPKALSDRRGLARNPRLLNGTSLLLAF